MKPGIHPAGGIAHGKSESTDRAAVHRQNADALDICRAFSAEIEYSDENLEALRFDLECDF